MMESLRFLLRRPGASLKALDPLMQCLAPRLSRSMATEAQSISRQALDSKLTADVASVPSSFVPRAAQPDVTAIVYNFPTMEPLRYAQFPAKYLKLPLRKDILHRAVVFEGDATRQGTASTKWRDDVHGSGRKLHQQKGTGRARVSDKKSPIRRGGGVAFGPHPRDFSTGLPKKVYDLAWRTALSYRYKKGELIVVDNIWMPEGTGPRLFKNIFEANGWGNANKRSLLVAGPQVFHKLDLLKLWEGLPERPSLKEWKEAEDNRIANMVEAMEECGNDGKLRTYKNVDVKNILEMGRIIIEERTLRHLLERMPSDL